MIRAILTLLRSVAIEGSLVARVADYREHHAFAEREGARHSPHTGR